MLLCFIPSLTLFYTQFNILLSMIGVDCDSTLACVCI